jgi:hypothetical protein
MREKLPLEILRDKYIPVSQFPEKYNISVSLIMRLINSGKLKYAEFKAPGDTRRSPHVNPEDLFQVLEEGDIE